MSRSRWLALLGAGTVGIGAAATVVGAANLSSDAPWLALTTLGLVGLVGGTAALIGVQFVVLRRADRNASSIRDQSQRTGRRVLRMHDRQVTTEDLTSTDGPVQRTIDEGRVELQALSEAVVANSMAVRRAIEASHEELDGLERSVTDEVATLHGELEGLTERMQAEQAQLHGEIRQLQLAHKDLPSELHTLVKNELTEELRRASETGAPLHMLARSEATTLFSLLENLHKIRDQLDLDAPLPPFGGWAIRSDLGALLVELALSGRYPRVVDLGSGQSTILLAAALRQAGDGHVVSVDHLSEYAEETGERLQRQGLSDWATVVTAPLVTQQVEGESYLWYDLSGVDLPDRIDLLHVDGPPGTTGPYARYPAVPLLRDRLGSGSVVLLDDADRPDEQETAARWTEQLEGSRATHIPHAVGTFRLDVGAEDEQDDLQ